MPNQEHINGRLLLDLSCSRNFRAGFRVQGLEWRVDGRSRQHFFKSGPSDRLRSGILEALHPVDGPEVGGKRGVAHELIGHVEVTLVTPPEMDTPYKPQALDAEP